jgi:hypothetical protein
MTKPCHSPWHLQIQRNDAQLMFFYLRRLKRTCSIRLSSAAKTSLARKSLDVLPLNVFNRRDLIYVLNDASRKRHPLASIKSGRREYSFFSLLQIRDLLFPYQVLITIMVSAHCWMPGSTPAVRVRVSHTCGTRWKQSLTRCTTLSH